jgi:hypothetical protein
MGAKGDTIGVIRGSSAKLPYHKGLVLIYPMKNETLLVRHIIERQGCGYTMKDDKSVNERIRQHLKTKPKSRLCKRGGNKGKY